MKIKKNLSAIAIAAVFLAFGIACQKNAGNTAVNQTVVNNTSQNTTANAANGSGNAQGPAIDAYKALYTARKNKDIPGLKSLMSKDLIKFFEEMGKDKKQSVDDMLKELCDRPQAATAEARNEKITGDRATIEYLDEDGKWQPMDLIKEDGVWKLTISKDDTDEVPPPANNKG